MAARHEITVTIPDGLLALLDAEVADDMGVDNREQAVAEILRGTLLRRLPPRRPLPIGDVGETLLICACPEPRVVRGTRPTMAGGITCGVCGELFGEPTRKGS